MREVVGRKTLFLDDILNAINYTLECVRSIQEPLREQALLWCIEFALVGRISIHGITEKERRKYPEGKVLTAWVKLRRHVKTWLIHHHEVVQAKEDSDLEPEQPEVADDADRNTDLLNALGVATDGAAPIHQIIETLNTDPKMLQRVQVALNENPLVVKSAAAMKRTHASLTKSTMALWQRCSTQGGDSGPGYDLAERVKPLEPEPAIDEVLKVIGEALFEHCDSRVANFASKWYSMVRPMADESIAGLEAYNVQFQSVVKLWPTKPTIESFLSLRARHTLCLLDEVVAIASEETWLECVVTALIASRVDMCLKPVL